MPVVEGGEGVPNARGKLPQITQSCGNRRFTAPDDSGERWEHLEPNPTRKDR